MLDRDLAMLYGVPTKALNQAVKRNIDRFPEDFMFQLAESEEVAMRSQIVTASESAYSKKKNIRFASYVFTEQGIAMLSSVLNSPKAIRVNIQIIRIFTKLREMLDTYQELRLKVDGIWRGLACTPRHHLSV